MSKQKIAIIVAGGKGERMNATIPKQFIEISGKPIVMHTIEAFLKYDKNIEIILVIPSIEIELWESLCKKHAFFHQITIVTGGLTRFYSVKNGLDTIAGNALVAVHDGVRPFASIGTISRSFDEAEKSGAAIPVVDFEDSIRQLTPNGSKAVERTAYKLVQTPQVFDAELLRKAYQQTYSTFFTDDASVVEGINKNVSLVEGNKNNIKITTEIDLLVAEALLQKECLDSQNICK